MIRLQVDIGEGLRKEITALGKMGDLALAVAQEIQTHVDLCFRAETDPWGRKWQELTEGTLDKRRGTSAQILVDTGILRGSVLAGPDGAGAVVGTEDIRAGVHQFGFGAIPARPFMPLNEGGLDMPADWEADIQALVDAWVERALA